MDAMLERLPKNLRVGDEITIDGVPCRIEPIPTTTELARQLALPSRFQIGDRVCAKGRRSDWNGGRIELKQEAVVESITFDAGKIYYGLAPIIEERRAGNRRGPERRVSTDGPPRGRVVEVGQDDVEPV